VTPLPARAPWLYTSPGPSLRGLRRGRLRGRASARMNTVAGCHGCRGPGRPGLRLLECLARRCTPASTRGCAVGTAWRKRWRMGGGWESRGARGRVNRCIHWPVNTPVHRGSEGAAGPPASGRPKPVHGPLLSGGSARDPLPTSGGPPRCCGVSAIKAALSI